MAEGYVEVKALGRRRVVYTFGWNYHALGRTALLLNRSIPPLIPYGEVIVVGRAVGIDLNSETAAPWRALFANVPDSWTPSMAVDLAAGNRLELPWLAGKVVDLGRKLGVPTPVNSVVYAALTPFAHGAQNS